MTPGRLIAGVVAAAALLAATPATSGAALLDATCPGPTNGGSTSSQGQTFTAIHTGTLVRGEMFVAKTAGASFQMQIYAAGPSGPTGSPLGTTAIPDSAVANVASPGPASPSAPIDGTFSPGVPVVAGQQYAIYVSRPGSTYISKDRSGNPCPGGEWGLSGGVWSAEDPGYDFPFSTYVNPPNDFTIAGKAKKGFVPLNLPGPGALDVAGKRIKSGHHDYGSGGFVRIFIRLSKQGKALVRRRGKLTVKAAITYTPTGGEPKALSVKVKFSR